VEITPQDLTLDMQRSTAVFRVLQESLTNVERHAAATHVHVRLQRETTELILTVQDDGCGLRADQLDAPRSLGLLGMRERALSIGGQFAVNGLPGKGTTVQMRIPLPQNARAEENV
jgi:signal transduction histidine kinase